jgi:hypothetical protein
VSHEGGQWEAGHRVGVLWKGSLQIAHSALGRTVLRNGGGQKVLGTLPRREQQAGELPVHEPKNQTQRRPGESVLGAKKDATRPGQTGAGNDQSLAPWRPLCF